MSRNYRGRRSGFSSKLCLRTNNQAIPTIYPRRCWEDASASNNIQQTLARKPSLNLITIQSQTTVSKTSIAKPAASPQFVPSLFLSNVMSLAPKIDEVNSVVINANVDVVCITETWLQSHNPDSVVAINGFNLIRRDRKEAIHGGVCMYIKASIPYTILGDLEDENGSFEVLWIKLRPTRLPRGISSIVAGVVYHPPQATNSMMLDYLTKCLMDLESKYPNCGLLVLDDFNHLNDARLKSNFNLKQIVHFPTRGQNTLDKILTNLQDYYDTPVERPAFGLSDHSSVEVQPKQRAKTSQSMHTVISRDLRPSNRLAMRTYLNEVDVTALIRAMSTCEEKVSMLQKIIKTGLDFVLPMKPKIVHRTEPPWINSTLKNLIRKRQKALGRGDRAEFNHLRNLVNRERKRCRAKYYECKVQHLKGCSPAKWWGEIKRLSGMEGPSGSRDNIFKSVHHLEGARGLSADDLANHINTTFLAPMEVFVPLTHNPFRGDASVSSSRTMNDDFPPLSEFSIFRKLCSINPAKAQGPDGIPGWLLKENADLLAPPIMDIMNSSFREGRLPLSWKEADIVPVPKQRPIQDVNKHLRPISLTPILSKFAEDYVVHDFVMPAVLKKIDKRQYGTIPKSCSTHALVSMIHNWHVSSDGNSAAIRAVLFDFRKAFDLIDHNILVRKLSDYDIPNPILCWIVDFLSDRRQRVKLAQDCLSEWRYIPAGVPQGTKLGPWLFLIMINDLKAGEAEMWKYVDDTTISEVITKGQKSCIQQMVDDLAIQARNDGFQLNERKCKELRISFAKNEPEFDPIWVNRQTLETVNSVKLLGLNISSDLKWNVHVSELVRKVSTRLCFLRQLKKSHVATRELLLFYITCIRSILEYGSPVFHRALPSYLSEDLERLQKRAMKIIYPELSYAKALELSGLPTLYDRRESIAAKLFDEICANQSHSLHKLLPSRYQPSYYLRGKRTFIRPKCKTERCKNSFLLSFVHSS